MISICITQQIQLGCICNSDRLAMFTSDSLKAFVYAAEQGSFSAAARHMGKAQSAVSTAIANLEIDCGVTLFDRSGRSPVLTKEGQALLPHARGILLGNRELLAAAGSMAEGIEMRVSMTVEHGLNINPLAEIFQRFRESFPSVTLEVNTCSPSELAVLLRHGQTDIGMMVEQEGYPAGFQFRGIGYSKMIAVCAPDHPLAACDQASYGDLRQHHQLLRHKSPVKGTVQQNEKKSASVWYVDDPLLILNLVRSGIGWAELPITVAAKLIQSGDIVALNYAFQQNDLLEGVDLVWTEQRALGRAGQWMRDDLLKLPQSVWQE